MPDLLYPVLRRMLFGLDPERAHGLALSALQYAHFLGLVPRLVRDDPSAGVSLMGLRFRNRVGLAAGFDKNARYVGALAALGLGFIEVGTVTPKPQQGQPKPRLFRVQSARALINRMGFPNEGAQSLIEHLSLRSQAAAHAAVCGINIGKNAATPLDDAVRDYVQCFHVVAAQADYVAINVSSPNTKDLRRLQQVDQLRRVLEALLAQRERTFAAQGRRVPLLVKISPDLSAAEVVRIGELVRELGLDGVIATNTTVRRPGLDGVAAAQEEGGLSGAPLAPLALQAVRVLRTTLGATTPIIAVGGIDSGIAALDAVKAGADLVQIYTGLIYRGPRLIGEIVEALEKKRIADSG